MNNSNNKFYWKPAITIRLNMIGDKRGVQISDAFGKRRYRISKEDFLEFLNYSENDFQSNSKLLSGLETIGILTNSDQEFKDYLKGVEHWDKYNWNLALGFYLWSSRVQFLDEGDNYEEIRCNALKQMLELSDLPLPKKIEKNDEVYLGSLQPIPDCFTVGDILKRRVTSQLLSSQGQLSTSILHSLLFYGFQASRKYHVPDVEDHIHNILFGVGLAFDPYLAIFDVNDLQPGIYYYSISQDSLKLIKSGDFRKVVCEGLIGHQQALTASFTVFLVADFSRFQWRYRHERALRNMYVDVGRIAQYFILIATAYGIKNHLTPATVDDVLSNLLETDPTNQSVLYSITLGY